MQVDASRAFHSRAPGLTDIAPVSASELAERNMLNIDVRIYIYICRYMHNYIYIIHIHYTRGLQLISARVKQQVDGCDMLCASMLLRILKV